MSKSQKAGFFGGLLVSAVIFFFIDINPANPIITKTAAIAALMPIWWLTEAIPLAATSFIVCFFGNILFDLVLSPIGQELKTDTLI